jgi:hypothetical protein
LVPEQFSWLDQGLVGRHFIDRCSAPGAALYLFLVTVADAQGLSYYGAATLARRLHLSDEALAAARQQLIDLDLIAYQAPLYQVLALPGTFVAPRPSPSTSLSPSPSTSSSPPERARSGHADAAQSLGELFSQLERRRDRL